MGSLKDEMYNRPNPEFDKKLADALGITVDELAEIEYDHVDDVTTNDDAVTGLIYEIQGNEKVLNKIKGLDKYNRITLDPNTLGYYADDDDNYPDE